MASGATGAFTTPGPGVVVKEVWICRPSDRPDRPVTKLTPTAMPAPHGRFWAGSISYSHRFTWDRGRPCASSGKEMFNRCGVRLTRRMDCGRSALAGDCPTVHGSTGLLKRMLTEEYGATPVAPLPGAMANGPFGETHPSTCGGEVSGPTVVTTHA